MSENVEPESAGIKADAVIVSSLPVDVGLLRARSPAEMIVVAKTIADPLAELIQARELFTVLGSKKHVHYEGWSTMLAMLGISPQERWTKEIKTEVGIMCQSYVDLVRLSDGKIVGGASAKCGGPDELDWHSRPKYEWRDREDGGGREKVQVGTVPVPEFQRTSMATTRAAGKAARLAFSWIVELAGFSGTPAEEMRRDDFGGGQKRSESPAGSKARRMSSKYEGACAMCGAVISKGGDIAYGNHVGELANKAGRKAKGDAAHWECYADLVMKGSGDEQDK